MTEFGNSRVENQSDLTTTPVTTPSATNPMSFPTISVSVPSQLNIELVDASALGDYEFFIFASSVVASVFTGCLVEIFKATEKDPIAPSFIAITAFILILLCTLLFMAITKRKKMKGSVKKIEHIR